jgi:ubiquinone biosynthesis protein
MLVMEWIDGVKIDDRIALEAAGHDIAAVTNIAAASFFNQVFRDGYFHGDMHPGNIFITADGTLVPIDFGIMGQLDLKDRLFLAQLLVAILTRDYDKVASLHADAGMLPDDISLPLFSQNLRAVVDPVLGKSLGDISLGLVLGQILRLSTRFEISVQPQFTLLQKTMVMAEGVARSLNPNANMWELSKPLAEKWMADHAHPAAVLHRTITEVSSIIRRLPNVLDRLEQDPEPPAKQPYFAMIITSLLSVTAIVISLAALLR